MELRAKVNTAVKQAMRERDLLQLSSYSPEVVARHLGADLEVFHVRERWEHHEPDERRERDEGL